MRDVPELVWPVAAEVGEGPVWLAGEAALWFVDILGGAIHRFHPATDMRETFAVGGKPSFVLPLADGGMAVGDGCVVRRFERGALGAPIATVAMPPGNRTNDGAVALDGTLWFGTMDEGESTATGAIYRLHGGAARRMGGDAIVTNGPAISPDGRLLYHVDSVAGLVWRFRIDGDSLGDGEVLIRIAPADGKPDGVVVDAEGCLWLALWDGWGVRRYTPDGVLLQTVGLPCARVTKLALGGPDLRTAYVTTARVGLSGSDLAEQPLAGGLFRFEVAVPGVPCPVVRPDG